MPRKNKKKRYKLSMRRLLATLRSQPLKKTPFSKNQLLFFAVVFAAIGGYIIWRSFAIAPAQTYYVSPTGSGDCLSITTACSFDTALTKATGGETIQLSDGEWPSKLVISNYAPSSLVTITGSRNAILNDGMRICNSSNIKLTGVTIEPAPGALLPAKLDLCNAAHDINLDNIYANGRELASGFQLDEDFDTYNVTLQNSEITYCGQDTLCVRPYSSNIQILNNYFHDCERCDFIKGGVRGSGGAVVSGNTFGKVYAPADCTPSTCQHLHQLYLTSNGPYTIENNTFDACSNVCTSQIYFASTSSDAANRIRETVVQNNIFIGRTNWGIRLEAGWAASPPTPKKPFGCQPTDVACLTNALPRDIKFNNNTLKSDPKSTSIYITSLYSSLDVSLRPVVANNILQIEHSGLCDYSHHSSNLAVTLLRMPAPCSGDGQGDPQLNPDTFGPTAASALILNKADPAYAPVKDFYDQTRTGAPDIGAIEYKSDTSSPTASITSPDVGSTVGGLVVISANAADDTAVASVQFQVDGNNFGDQDTRTLYSLTWDTTTVANGSHTLTAIAKDLAGRVSTSSPITVTVDNLAPPIDTTPPAVPANLRTTGVTAVTADLAWDASTNGGSGLAGYKIFRDGNLVATSRSANYSDTRLNAGTTYSYTVAAYDRAGNISALSSPISVTTSGSVTPAPTLNFTASPTAVSPEESSTLTWTTTDATDCIASGDWDGTVATSDSVSTGPLADSSTFVLTCSGPGGTVTASVIITVNPTPSPSPSPTPTPSPVSPHVTADLNNSGHVDVIDLSILLSHYSRSGAGDIDNSGLVDVIDLSILLSNYGK